MYKKLLFPTPLSYKNYPFFVPQYSNISKRLTTKGCVSREEFFSTHFRVQVRFLRGTWQALRPFFAFCRFCTFQVATAWILLTFRIIVKGRKKKTRKVTISRNISSDSTFYFIFFFFFFSLVDGIEMVVIIIIIVLYKTSS